MARVSYSLLFVAVVATLLISTSAFAQKFDDPASLTVKNVLHAFALDGKLDDPDWTGAPTLLYGNGAFLNKQPGEHTVTGEADIKASYDYNAGGTDYGIFHLPDRDSSWARVKFLRKGMNLYIGITSNDKSICKFDWEGDGLFLIIKTAAGVDQQYKLYWQNLNDTIKYEEPSPNWGFGAGYLPPGSTVNDSSDVDNGYQEELMVRLDSLGYTPGTLSSVQLALVRFDPNHYQHPMNSYDTLHGTYYKSWWGSEWGGTYRTLNFTPEPVKFDDPPSLTVKNVLHAFALDGKLDDPDWTGAPTLLYGNGAFLN